MSEKSSRARESLLGWGALGIAFVLAIIVAPWDTRSETVASGSSAPDALGGTTPSTAPLPGGSPLPGTPTTPGFTPGTTPGSTPGTGGRPAITPSGSTGPRSRDAVLGRGVTHEEVKVGYIWLRGQEEAANDFGFSVTPAGEVDKQIAAFTTWVNRNGGIGGKRLVSIVREIDFRTSSTQTEQDLCAQFTQQDEVFAVVLVGQIREVTRRCYTDQGVLTFDPSGFPMSANLYEQTAPLLWSPSYPTISETSRVLPPALKAQGFWKPGLSPNDRCTAAPCVTGILMYDFPNYHRVLNQVMRPALAKVGIEVPDPNVQLVDASDAATIQSGLTNATVQFQARGVTRVLFIGGSPLAPFFMTIAKQQRYTPVYGITSFDQPRFATDPANGRLVGDQIKGAMGIGVTPVLDVFDRHWTNHAPMWDACVKIYNDAGFTWPDSVGARVPVGYCESTLMLDHVASKIAPDLTGELWAAAAGTLGGSLQTATGIDSRFSATKRAGGAVYRYLRYDFDCECFLYRGRNRTL